MTKFYMPKFEETAESAIVVQWLKKPGDTVKEGEALVEVETEKFTHPIDSPFDAIVLTIDVAEGVEVEVGTLLATLEPLNAGA